MACPIGAFGLCGPRAELHVSCRAGRCPWLRVEFETVIWLPELGPGRLPWHPEGQEINTAP